MENNLGELLKTIRKEKRYSLAKVGTLTGISASYINRIEKGNRTNPTVFILKRMADAYKIDLITLVNATVQNM